MDLRECSWCYVLKPLSDFYRVSSSKGFRGQCRACMRVIKQLQRDPDWRPPCQNCGVMLERKRVGGRRLCPTCLTTKYGDDLRPGGSHRLALAPCFRCGKPKTVRFRMGRLCEECSPWRQGKDTDRARMLWQKYSITLAQYDAMLQMQGGGCWICGRVPKSRRLAVEHDHGPSKRVRGLVCHLCNKLRIGINTPETARKVLAYLESDFDGRLI